MSPLLAPLKISLRLPMEKSTIAPLEKVLQTPVYTTIVLLNTHVQ